MMRRVVIARLRLRRIAARLPLLCFEPESESDPRIRAVRGAVARARGPVVASDTLPWSPPSWAPPRVIEAIPADEWPQAA